VYCDAFDLGRVDGPDIAERVRTIPAPIRRAVLARDHHRCTVPGCRSSRFVDLHHIKPWADGGEHHMDNLTTLCCLHHDAGHDGRLQITGAPGALLITHADGRPYGTPPPEDDDLPACLAPLRITHVERPAGSPVAAGHRDPAALPAANGRREPAGQQITHVGDPR
jgi:hypothetical protein